MVEELLKELQFSKKESAVYIALLGFDAAIAATVAKKTGLNRTTVYDILTSLIQKGLVSKHKRSAKTFFTALDPKQLLSYIDREQEEQTKKFERQKQKVSALLPELVSLQKPTSTKPKVQFFEGEKGVREAYEHTLTCRDTIYAYTNVEEMFTCLPNVFPNYFKRRAQKKIPIKAIFVDNPTSRQRAALNQQELRQTKFLPNPSDSFSPETKIYNNTIMIASWSEKMAILIESKELADQQKIIFNTLWDLL